MDSHCGYAHGQLTVGRRSAHSTPTASSRCAHGQLAVLSRSADSTPTVSSRYAHGQLAVRSRSAHSTPTVSSQYSHGQLIVRPWSAGGTLTCQYVTATDPTNGRSHVTRPTSGSGCSSKEHSAPKKLVVCAETAHASVFAHMYNKLKRDGIPPGRSL